MNFSSQPSEILYKNLNLYSYKKKILNNVSGKISNNTMVALIGTSGAGKSSLLNSLAGRLDRNQILDGTILINKKNRDPLTWSKIIGYVEQEFYAYETQTVEETFSMICKLKKEDPLRVNEILDILNLVSVKNNMISQLSGGEKKRVSIGIEIIGNPNIIFLDEPTSGLDSFNALNILDALNTLKQRGKSILVTIHQPSFKMLEYFDKIILLGRGNVIFDGKFDACIDFFAENKYNCPMNTNPSDFFLETISINTTNLEKKEKSEKALEDLVEAWKNKKVTYSSTITDQLNVKREYMDYNSFIPLLKRNFSGYLRDLTYIKILFCQKTVFLLIIGLTFLNLGKSQQSIQSRAGAITFMSIDALFGTCSPIFNIFSIEKKIIKRERYSGFYDGINAFLAKWCVEFSLRLIFTVYYVAADYWLVGFNYNVVRFFMFLIIQISLLAYAVAYAFFISAISSSPSIAQIVGSTILIIFTVYGGFFSDPSTIPIWLRWIIWVSPVYYAFRASMSVVFGGQNFNCEGIKCMKTGKDVLDRYGIYNNHVLGCVFVIWGFIFLILFLGCCSLHYVTRLRMNLSSSTKEDLV